MEGEREGKSRGRENCEGERDGKQRCGGKKGERKAVLELMSPLLLNHEKKG